MIKNKLATLLAAGALVAGAQVQAAQIDGSVGMTGTYTPNNNIMSLATSITINTANVDVVNGDLATTISVGDAVTMASPITVGANGPLPIPAGSIWAVGGFQLDLTTFTQLFENVNQLAIGGTGILSGNGYDPTPGDFQLNFTRSGSGASASLTFSATSAGEPTRTPDGGATAMLLGLGVLGMATLRRKLS